MVACPKEGKRKRSVVEDVSTKVSTLFGGVFCPPNLENKDRLKYYSDVFDYIHLKFSLFYRIPNQSTFGIGSERVPTFVGLLLNF
jgi:hypothetical protein